MNFPLKPGAKIAKGECNTKPKSLLLSAGTAEPHPIFEASKIKEF